MAKQVPWTKFIYDTFCEEAMLNETERFMMYNDYQKTAQLFNLQSDVEFYFSLARDFIEDVDAKPFKIERYFEYN